MTVAAGVIPQERLGPPEPFAAGGLRLSAQNAPAGIAPLFLSIPVRRETRIGLVRSFDYSFKSNPN
jgi:hypothetical protein